jgi:hypothetical protein
MKPRLLLKREKKQRVNFYASDCQKLEADIWLELKGVEPTNPAVYTDSLKWSAGHGVEAGICKILKENGHISETYNQETQESTKITREGIVVSMKFDALTKESEMVCDENLLPQTTTLKLKDGEPFEVKSINNKNFFDIQKYIDGKPKENYVMQLSIYQDALSKDTGYLFVASIDGLNAFIFENKKIGEGKYQCGNTIVNIADEYKRFAEINRKFVAGEEPNYFEEIYKLPLEKIDWHLQTKTDISKARNNQKVIGSAGKWKLDYSPYKKLILEKQGVAEGYTDEELVTINELTKGYTTWK